MKEKIAWVIDSTGFLDDDLRAHPDVFVIPIQIQMEGKDYQDHVDITNTEIFHAIEERDVVVTTSQPSVGQFRALYEKLAELQYTAVFAFLVSKQLSGTVSSSVQASQLVKIPVYTFDSQLLSYPMTYIMKKAMDLYNSGHSHQDILKKAAFLRDSNETYVLIGSLHQLHKSGRLHSIKYYLGNLLKIKPIISLVKGKLIIQGVARNESHAEKMILSRLKYAVEQYNISDCLLLYGQFYTQSEQWMRKIQRLYPDLILHVYPLGTVIGVHAGGNTVGISWFKEKI